jgi:hypothetical protein
MARGWESNFVKDQTGLIISALRFPFPLEQFPNEHNPRERIRSGAMGFGREAIVEACHAKSLAVTGIFEEV